MMVGEYLVQKELRHGCSQSLKDGKAFLKIRLLTFYVKPKEKFVRRTDKIVVLEKKDLATYEITTPYTFERVKKSKSRLGSGMRLQTDDLYVTTEWEEDVITYDIKELNKFIEQKLSLHKHEIYE